MKREELAEWQKTGREALSAQLSAQMMPETLNPEERTVDIVWFTGIDVPRMNAWTGEPYTLRFDPKGVDLSNLNAGAPVLDDHNDENGVNGQMGVVAKAWVESPTSYKATLRFSKRPEVNGIWQDVADKIIQKFSMGTEILEKQDISGKNDKMKTFLATKWRPYEISMAPIPADFQTTTLSADFQPQEPQPVAEVAAQEGASARPEKETEQMSEQLNQTGADVAAPVIQPVNEGELRKHAARAERLRITTIDNRLKLANLPAEATETLRNELIEGGFEGEELSNRIFTAMAERPAEQVQTRSAQTAGVVADKGDKIRETMAATLLCRYEPQRYKDQAEKAREWTGLSIMELGRECLRQKGQSTRAMSQNDIAQLMLTTSDFPNILMDVANKTLRAGYEAYPNTFQAFARKVTARDFKNIHSIALGGAPALLQVNEHGEFKEGAFKDSQEQYSLATYGRIVSITRQALINDDLGAFTRIPELMGRKAAILEGDIVWGKITANANMADGNAIFSTQHANYDGTGTVMTADTIGSGSAKISVQTDPNGDVLSLVPKYLVTPVSLRMTAQKLQQPTQVVVVNSGAATSVTPAWVQALTPITEPRLDRNSTTAWYLFADPNMIDTVEYAYLEGQEGMYFETQMGFDIDGTRFKARHDFGAAVVDWRGLYKNAGA